MAEEVTVWRANDGTIWNSQSQALAYELKIYLINLGKSAASINVDATGTIDAVGMNTLAGMAVSALGQIVPAAAAAYTADVAAASPAQPAVTS